MMFTRSQKRKAQDAINDMSIEKEKKQKVKDKIDSTNMEEQELKTEQDEELTIENTKKDQSASKPKTLFGKLPDEMALHILSFCSTEDSRNTRVWQTEIVKRCAETTCKLKAARNNNLDAMKWIYNYIGDTKFIMKPSRGFQENWTEINRVDVVVLALKNENFEMLKWLKMSNCPWDARTFMYATRHSTLEVMKWLKAEGCPFDTSTFWAATATGDLQKMKWLRDNGCLWDSNTIGFAKSNSNRSISRATVAWLKANGYPKTSTRFWWGETAELR